MTDSADSPSDTKTEGWSDRLADRFACSLGPVLADWFDRELWTLTGTREFHVAATPKELLESTPESIWPGLMNADLVPIVSNGAGDWLCASMGADNVLSKIVHWYHGGGDWIEWGDDLAQAIVFDAIQSRLPGSRRRHATPAETIHGGTGSGATAGNGDADPMLAWALNHVPPTVGDLFRDNTSTAGQVADVLIDHEVAEVAVRFELVQAALNISGLEEVSIEGLSPGSGAFAKASFDRDTVSFELAKRISLKTGSEDWRAQDWSAAETHAVAVTQRSPESAWAWDVAGYAAMRRGDSLVAMGRWLCGSQCQLFSDQSVRLQTHWAASIAAKFSAAMLAEHFPSAVQDSEYLTLLCEHDAAVRSDRVSRFWMAEGEEALAGDDGQAALDGFVAAGWDIGMRPITAYADLLDRIATTAQKIGQPGRARLAEVHRECLRDRYGA